MCDKNDIKYDINWTEGVQSTINDASSSHEKKKNNEKHRSRSVAVMEMESNHRWKRILRAKIKL